MSPSNGSAAVTAESNGIKKVVVVGSGVVGLSIALQLKVQGDYEVTIVGRDLPSDTESPHFASPWAGANWASKTSDERQQVRDEATFKQWQNWAANVLPSKTMATMPFSEYNHANGENKQVNRWRSSFLPDYRSSVSGDQGRGVTQYTGLTLDAHGFLYHLQTELGSKQSTFHPRLGQSSAHKAAAIQRPVTILRATVERLSDVYKHVPDAQLIVNATGLGAKFLLDVKDESVYPIRGQTVLVEASNRMRQSPYCVMKGPTNGSFDVQVSQPEDQEFCYVIPRAKSGSIICGGSAFPNDWSSEVDRKLSDRILQRCVKLVPELLEEGVDATSEEAWKTVRVLAHGSGLRPGRKDGLRLEIDHLTSPSGQAYDVLHAYGSGSGGYQSSYGIAVEAYHKIDEFFQRSTTRAPPQ